MDCGGPCRACQPKDYVAVAWPTARWVILCFFLLVILYLLNAIFSSRMIFLFQHGKAIHFFYEDPPTYALIKAWNALARPFRFGRHKELSGLVAQAMGDLRELRKLPSPAMKPALAAKLRGLYAAMLNLSPGFEFDQLLATVRHGHFPFTLQVIILKNTKLLSLLELAKLYEDSEYALDEVLHGLEELRKAF